MAKYRAIPQGFMTVGEVAKKMGVTVRTLQYYDKEGLLCHIHHCVAEYWKYIRIGCKKSGKADNDSAACVFTLDF